LTFEESLFNSVLRAAAHSAKCVLGIVILSVYLSVCHDPVPIQAEVRETLGFHCVMVVS